jgi:hypothetical protein
MQFQLKPISKDGVPAALQKAERYRFLNEPSAAESICLDVLQVDPDNQQALVMLLLSITDGFGEGLSEGLSERVRRAREVLARVRDEYKRHYYNGIICERRAKAQIRQGAPRAAEAAYEWLREAMDWYEKAEAMRPPGNDEAILRWNTCVRILARNPRLAPRAAEAYEPSLGE